MVQLDHKEGLVSLGTVDAPEHQDSLDFLDLMEREETLGPQVDQESKVEMDHKELMETQDQLEEKEHQGIQVYKDQRVPVGTRETKETKDCKEKKEI
jgi:hypothetical protein